MTARTAVLTGRFAPFCNAHLGMVWHALKDSDEVVIVVTDADLARSSRLPWSADERVAMAKTALVDFEGRIRFEQTDAPAVHVREPCALEQEAALSGLYADDDGTVEALLPSAIVSRVKALRGDPDYAGLREEHRYLQAYKAMWAVAPYPPVLASVDAVIVHSGHLLLVERGGVPGKGLWALPGGFVEPDEWLVDSALRELREETGLQLSDDEARNRLKSSHVFDDPWRSGRGRVITHAFHFELDGADQPEVSGQDDAAAARWVPLEEVKTMRGQFFDDHGRIIAHFLKI